ncbi:MAG: bifunctional homocysteine S-methyltransferase/methylenetetrahydrofolate reductase [Brevefilum sp.]|nr:bifunctional homocysteine S-methyltransferase/methylenetetrahydrofolate reductase [Brevefilum sp.]MDT8382184.1 bifunctional homocysteine S-methyltransferase/methylenetetrahydrofolate reductase [Brevefilum sp.]MDW7755404.1 bifunctional homocysteine S-methyltransferase/methylenetetrahydrofolate reductase [Brevefilum sp.]
MSHEERKFRTRLNQATKPIVTDGAMGTLLHERGVEIDACFDELNLTEPAVVAEIHRDYIQAGAEIIKTNTFGANRTKLERHGLDDRVGEVNAAAVNLAQRVVAASFKEVFIAGDMGPLGVPLAPFGRMQVEEAREVYKEQAQALVDAGVDLILIETMVDLYAVRAAVEAVRQVDPNVPIIASMTFTRDRRTLLGDTPQEVAIKINDLNVDVIGVNCSGGPSQLLYILRQMVQTIPDGKFSVMPNAGFPEKSGGRIMYPAGPEYFHDYALSFWRSGAAVIGGCCGTTPAHIKVIAETIQKTSRDSLVPVEVESEIKAEIELGPVGEKSKLAQKLEEGKFVIAVEMDPPRGLSLHKRLAGASLLADAGADVIDVADSPMARMRMSPWAVCHLIQSQYNIETTLHFPTRGRNLLRVQGDLLAAHAMNIHNVFVVMGDPTAIGDYPDASDSYDLVPTGLIRLIKEGFNFGVDHSGGQIGQPTNFFVGAALNLCPNKPEREIHVLRKKLKSGADFFLTQPVFDLQRAREFIEMYRNLYGPLNVPILVGILPLVTDRHARFLHNEVPGISIPDEIQKRMSSSGEESASEGARIAIELIQDIKSDFQGVYFMPAFNRYDNVAEIIDTIRP